MKPPPPRPDLFAIDGFLKLSNLVLAAKLSLPHKPAKAEKGTVL